MITTMLTPTMDWSPGEHLARVLREEQAASDMARSIEKIAREGDERALERAISAFGAFLDRELAVHLAKEEADLFPVLARRGLDAEVAAATKQHAEIRRLRETLRPAIGPREQVRETLHELATTLRRHIAYEADFLYVDLRRAEAEEYRADVEAALADGAGG
jgi:DUF438 domain-containing protein